MIFARSALLPDGWHRDVRVAVAGGSIAAVTTGGAAQAGDRVVEVLLPGMANLHSHAFQRGFSGLTERRGAGQDCFWTWREMMYRFALTLDPEGAQALAELAYAEMLEAGFTRVGEFHYLHHAPDGRPYADPTEMSARIFAAADATGIALTHLPVFYAHGGFGPQAATEGQRRFLHGIEDFLSLVAACDAMVTRPQDRVGYAPHSLRAATADELRHLSRELGGRVAHIHVAEQLREVEDCIAFSGLRPVDYLFENAPVDARWCLIHATHLTAAERARIAASGAVAGLCPVTEANLGDGLFPAVEYLGEGGRIGLGTDSNIRIDLAEEMRVLEYGQRLTRHGRAVLAEAGGSTGGRLFRAALEGGAQALDAPRAAIAAGAPADLVALADPLALGADGDTVLDRWIFGREVAVADVWAAGRHVVTEGRHIAREAIRARAAAVLRSVLA